MLIIFHLLININLKSIKSPTIYSDRVIREVQQYEHCSELESVFDNISPVEVQILTIHSIGEK